MAGFTDNKGTKMTPTITQIPAPQVDVWSLAALYQAAVPQHAGKYPDQIIAQSGFQQSENTWFVAHVGEKLAGAGAMIAMRDCDVTRMRLDYFLCLNRCFSMYKDDLAKKAERNRQAYGQGEVIVQNFDNELTRAVQAVDGHDVYLFGVAVHPDFRRHGIATLLAEARIDHARNMQAGAAFTSCVEDSHSSGIYDKLGFSPIFLFGPDWHGGSAVKQMGRILK